MLEKLVSNLSPEQLDHLGLALLRFSQLGDLTAWLDEALTRQDDRALFELPPPPAPTP